MRAESTINEKDASAGAVGLAGHGAPAQGTDGAGNLPEAAPPRPDVKDPQ
jgi:hypothetical protein